MSAAKCRSVNGAAVIGVMALRRVSGNGGGVAFVRGGLYTRRSSAWRAARLKSGACGWYIVASAGGGIINSVP